MFEQVADSALEVVAELVERLCTGRRLIVGKTRQGDLVNASCLRDFHERDHTLLSKRLVGNHLLDSKSDHFAKKIVQMLWK
jgi:hypothetical protein